MPEKESSTHPVEKHRPSARDGKDQKLDAIEVRLPETPIKIDLLEKPAAPKVPPLSSVIKDELFLISSLILFVGIISTETYYQHFGVKYQFLSFPVFHIVYRGLTAIISSPSLLIPYIVAISWLVLDGYAIRRDWSTFLKFQRLLSYFFMLLILMLAYPLARRSGRNDAALDLHAKTTSLPTIIKLEATGVDQDCVAESEYRLLMIDDDYVMFFKPVAENQPNTIPVIHRLSKGVVHALDTAQ